MSDANRTPPTPSAEVFLKRYIQHINRVLNQTITESHLTHLRGPASNEWVIGRFEAQSFRALELRPKGRWLHFRQAVSVRRSDGKIIVRDALYHYSRSPDADDEQAKVFMYHYHRAGRPNQPQSHFHVCAERDGRSISDVHFPAGRVSIEQIIAHLLMERGVSSRRPLTDAISVLRASHLRFMTTLRTDEVVFP